MEEKQAAAATATNVDEPIETSALEAEHGMVMVDVSWRRVRSVALGSRHRQPRGMEQKLEAQFSECPPSRFRRAVSSSAYGRMGGAACAQVYSGGAGAGLRPVP